MSAAAGSRCPGPDRTSALPVESKLFLPLMTDEVVNGDHDLADVVALLDDEHVRSILVATSAEPLSAKELGDRCDLSVSSIYRRVDELRDLDLLEERTRPRSDGHHETVYASALARFELTIRDGDLEWTLERADGDVADELSRMWGNF
ncbi:Helix-turn-helix domain-containing protein [Halomicrobium zhouii]|uniref:Helix-turn-helix domain-containing protein n=2 Tax=Halomicrobium zhouii TaxID=767519 RepID=A0A1I6LX80_9EURY|nr:Helix-turn-helix domain-containing protein [Halomicrobium zhouii]